MGSGKLDFRRITDMGERLFTWNILGIYIAGIKVSDETEIILGAKLTSAWFSFPRMVLNNNISAWNNYFCQPLNTPSFILTSIDLHVMCLRQRWVCSVAGFQITISASLPIAMVPFWDKDQRALRRHCRNKFQPIDFVEIFPPTTRNWKGVAICSLYPERRWGSICECRSNIPIPFSPRKLNGQWSVETTCTWIILHAVPKRFPVPLFSLVPGVKTYLPS